MTRSPNAGWMSALLCLSIAALTTGPARGHDGARHDTADPPERAGQAAVATEVELHDLELIDKQGNPVRFVSDALADGIVAIDFVYTTCTTICPVLSSVFSLVQDGLGEHADVDVRLISVSIDPLRDTPPRLADYARKFDAGESWIWLTGEKATVDRVLAGLGAYSAEIADHPAMVVIGDAKRGDWRRLFGFPAPEDILAQIDALVAARDTATTTMKPGE